MKTQKLKNFIEVKVISKGTHSADVKYTDILT